MHLKVNRPGPGGPEKEPINMNILDINHADEIFAAHEPPCLSLYQPTHRTHPANQQDPIRFRNLIKALEDSLRQKYTPKESAPLLAPFRELADDSKFWNHTADGLAVLGARDCFQVFRLQRPVAELAVVADSFHIKPLLRILQSADRYQILGLSRQTVQLFEGNRDALDPIELPADVEEAVAQARGGDRKEPHVEVRTSSERSAAVGVRGGQGSVADLSDREAERFFRAVDRLILERYSRPSGLPLLLAALPEHHTPFRRISVNPMLLDQALPIHPGDLPVKELRDRAWQVVEPYFLTRLAGLIEMFGIARSKQLGEDDLALVMRAATAGRVATLLLEADRHIPGRVDAATGAIEFDDLARPDVDDLLDDLAERVIKNGGQVVIVPAERMPTRSGLAAIYRY